MTVAVKDAAAKKMMMIKDAVVKAAATSAYGARFKKVGLLRVVSPQVEEEEEGAQHDTASCSRSRGLRDARVWRGGGQTNLGTTARHHCRTRRTQ